MEQTSHVSVQAVKTAHEPPAREERRDYGHYHTTLILLECPPVNERSCGQHGEQCDEPAVESILRETESALYYVAPNGAIRKFTADETAYQEPGTWSEVEETRYQGSR